MPTYNLYTSMALSVSPSPPFVSRVLVGGVFAAGDVGGGVFVAGEVGGGVFVARNVAGGVCTGGVCSRGVFCGIFGLSAGVMWIEIFGLLWGEFVVGSLDS